MLTCGITMGDPAGIGPEVVIKTLQDKSIQRLANFLIIGNSFVMQKTAQICRMRLAFNRIENDGQPLQRKNRGILLCDRGMITKLVFGQAVKDYGLLALDCIKVALKLLKLSKIDVLVTAPVNKHTISQTGTIFKGHTEYLAKSVKTKKFAMMLLGGPFKITLVTRHIALKDVTQVLTKEKVYEAIYLTAFALKKYFDVNNVRIGVCGLNPHCGDGQLLGQEEAQVIRPAILRAKKIVAVEGPLSADAIFYSALQGKFDAIVAMYHDQGLIPLKTYAFHQGINVTLGLPFVRTSPDHGTAYDIAGKNKAHPGSMKEAIRLAIKIGYRLKNNRE
jgi:4-hydroxythreonine-4-phosphate dehydrogenase